MADYVIRRAKQPVTEFGWDARVWQDANEVAIDKRYEESADYSPVTFARVLYDDEAIYVQFRVQDRYVRAAHVKDHSKVYEDSCAEFFVQPPNPEGKYFNFEMNCVGALLLYKVKNCRANDLEVLPFEDLAMVQRYPSYPRGVAIEPEVVKDTVWTLAYKIPLDLFSKYFNIERKLSGQVWRGNFYKCGDKLSHPHWFAWRKTSEWDFHMPEFFGELQFE